VRNTCSSTGLIIWPSKINPSKFADGVFFESLSLSSIFFIEDMSTPTDSSSSPPASLRASVSAVLEAEDLDSLTVNKVLDRLVVEYGETCREWKAQVKVFIQELISEKNAGANDEEASSSDAGNSDDDDDDDDDDDNDGGVKNKKKRKQKEFWLSAPLSEVCGGVESATRGDVTKMVWEYIRKHNLQNPKDKREIVGDELLQKVFKRKKTTMFKMARLLTDNLYEIEDEPEEDEEVKPKKPEKPKATTKKSSISTKSKSSKSKSGTSNSKKRKAGEGESQSPAKKKQKDPNAPNRTPRNNLSDALKKVCRGVPALGRYEVVKALWVYIRENNLQNPNDKREIVCDENFKAIMGGNSTVSMFSMNKHVGAHMGEKVETPKDGWPKIEWLNGSKDGASEQ